MCVLGKEYVMIPVYILTVLTMTIHFTFNLALPPIMVIFLCVKIFN